MMTTLVSRALRVLGAGVAALGMSAALAHGVAQPASAGATPPNQVEAEYEAQDDLDAPIDDHLLPELEVGSI